MAMLYSHATLSPYYRKEQIWEEMEKMGFKLELLCIN